MAWELVGGVDGLKRCLEGVGADLDVLVVWIVVVNCLPGIWFFWSVVCVTFGLCLGLRGGEALWDGRGAPSFGGGILPRHLWFQRLMALVKMGWQPLYGGLRAWRLKPFLPGLTSRASGRVVCQSLLPALLWGAFCLLTFLVGCSSQFVEPQGAALFQH